jgi:hypothetical protein
MTDGQPEVGSEETLPRHGSARPPAAPLSGLAAVAGGPVPYTGGRLEG